MVANYVKTSLRAFRRTKVHTAVNVLGLALGFICAIIIFQKLRFEHSFDTYHPDADRIHRIVHVDTQFGEDEYQRGVPYPLVEAFRTDFPEVPHVAIVDRNFSSPVISIERPGGDIVRFRDEDHSMAYIDPSFLDIYHYEFLHGDPATALTEPRTVLLSESRARKYFPNTDVPIGKTLTINNRMDLTVVGVVKDPPLNTALPLHILASFNLGEEFQRGNDNWGSTSSGVQAHIKLPPGMRTAQIDQRLHGFLVKHRNEEVAQYKKFFLQPLPERHFDTRFGTDWSEHHISREAVWALALIGLFLLLTACINFVNMNTVLVFKRAKEVGVRKVLGGTPGQIAGYFLIEAALTTLIALGVALLLANPVLSLARRFVGEGFEANVLGDPTLLGAVLMAAVVVTLLSGIYPAFLLARLRPMRALRSGSQRKPTSLLSLRRSLVVVQFAISQVLIICTVTAMWQMDYLYSAPLGYNTEAVVEFNIPVRDNTKRATFKNQLLQEAAFTHVTFSNSAASSGNTWGSNFYYTKSGERHENETQIKLVDADYIPTYEMNLLAGENFLPGDSINKVIVNETAVRAMGFEHPEEALGTLVELWGYEDMPIVGVVQDFNTNSLHEPIENTILWPSEYAPWRGSARLETADLQAAVATLEQHWQATYPEFVLDYNFLDDNIRAFYEEEQTTQRLIQAFALIAILIGCIGLFGLIAYLAEQRAKEVGIRKVLGASVGSIVGLFSREFAVYVIVGFAVSAPAAYFLMRQWLEGFAYRIDLSMGLFLLAFAVSLGIALLTVGFKTYRAAIANPIEAIKYE